MAMGAILLKIELNGLKIAPFQCVVLSCHIASEDSNRASGCHPPKTYINANVDARARMNALNQKLWRHSLVMTSNDEVERRGVVAPAIEADLSRSSTLSLAHRSRFARDRSNRLLGANLNSGD